MHKNVADRLKFMHKNVADGLKFVHKNVSNGKKNLQTTIGMEEQSSTQTTHTQRCTPSGKDMVAQTFWRKRVQECGIRKLRQVGPDENHIRRGL